MGNGGYKMRAAIIKKARDLEEGDAIFVNNGYALEGYNTIVKVEIQESYYEPKTVQITLEQSYQLNYIKPKTKFVVLTEV